MELLYKLEDKQNYYRVMNTYFLAMLSYFMISLCPKMCSI